jgi:exodeoxyribonuclease VII small subunit
MDETIESLTFEEALVRLEQIVAELEGGDLALEEALQKFKIGMDLKEFCEQKLAEAEAQIEEYVASHEPDEQAVSGTEGPSQLGLE